MCTLVIRYMLWKKCEQAEGFGNFRPKLSREQFDLFRDLYSLLVQGPALEIATLAPIAHRIVFSAYTLTMNVRNKVDSALEQSIIFTTLTPVKGWYISVLSTTQIFAHIQRIGFSAFFHTAWHGGVGTGFALESQIDTDEDEDKDGEGGEEGDAADEIDDNLDGEAEEVQNGLELHTFKGPNSVEPMAHRELSLDDFDTAGEVITEPQSEGQDLGIDILEDRPDEDPILRYDSLYSYALPCKLTARYLGICTTSANGPRPSRVCVAPL
jgi:hypothetical protein